MTRAGFIGLGSQGAPMARRIAEAGFPLTIWADRPETLNAFAGTGAQTAVTPAELAAQSDIVGIYVTADDDVEDVVLRHDGVLAGMAPGGIIAIHSTVHPETCRQIADRARSAGVRVLDAPVRGGAPAAERGQLLVMVGGDADTVELARPLLSTYGNPVLHLGPLGSGQIAKILNNCVFTAQLALGLETFRFAHQLGVDQASMADVLAHGSGGSHGAAIIAGGGFGTASLKHVAETILSKDVAIMSDIAAAAEVEEPPHVCLAAHAALDMYATSPADPPSIQTPIRRQPTDRHRDLPLAVVVGAGATGMAVARRLASSHRILLADRDHEHLHRQVESLRSSGRRAQGLPCDVTDRQQVAQMAQKAAEMGDLRAIAHIVGLSPSMADGETILKVDLLGAALVADSFLQVAQEGTAAVFVSSVAAHLSAPSPELAAALRDPLARDLVDRVVEAAGGALTPGVAYQASKWALIEMCRLAAPAWGHKGARILSVSPGLIASPMGAREYQSQPDKQLLRAAIPLEREGTMGEIADAVHYLTSDAASYISGTDLLVDGGLAAAIRSGKSFQQSAGEAYQS